MRDPHVASLHYRLAPADTVTFAKHAPSVSASEDGFRAQLAGDALDIDMVAHHASEADARAAVEPYLRAWEIDHALRASGGEPEFSFEFVRSELVDRDPPPPGTHQAVHASAHISASVFVVANATVTRGSLPAPPSGFALDPDVETLWARWRAYRERREPLPGMAYFALTALERYGGRRGAAARFGIDQSVLSTLGHLVSERGDALTARKARGAAKPLTPQEAAWVEAAILAIVRRVGEIAADPAATSRPLTMGDLPPL